MAKFRFLPSSLSLTSANPAESAIWQDKDESLHERALTYVARSVFKPCFWFFLLTTLDFQELHFLQCWGVAVCTYKTSSHTESTEASTE